MNINKSIQNIISKVVIEKDEELAVIFKACQEQNSSKVYLPVGIVKGKLDEENLNFICNNFTFNHLIKGPEQFGFAYSKTITETVKNNRFIPLVLQEKKILKDLQKYYYIYAKDKSNNPIVGIQSIDDNNINILCEDELLNYYIKMFPKAKDIIDLLKKASGKLNLDIKYISDLLEKSFTNKEASKEILIAIWKHYHSDKSYHIFINGSEITPKKEIIKSICEKANIPYHFVSAVENYEITNIEEILKNLLEKSNYDLQLAENTILVIDNIDKLALTD